MSHLDDTDVDIVYYVSENRGAWGFQNKQTNKQTKNLQHVNRGRLWNPAKHVW